jgi:hypothetical protein
MIWVGWRQQRAEAAIVAAMLAVLVAVLLPTGLNVASAFDAGHLASCTGARTSQSCQQAIDQFLVRFNGLGGLIAWLTLLPGLVGTVLAAPLLVSLEQGTQRLDWTQSITRRRWLVTKLGLAAAAAVVAAVVLVLLVTWWRTPFVRLQGRMDNSVFDSEGTVVVGYTLFALALCTLVGVLWRRAVPALMVGFAGYFAVRILFDTVVRQHLLTPLQATWRADGAAPPSARHAWVLRQFPSDRLGHRAPFDITCAHGPDIATNCPPKPSGGYMHAVYHPASHFWALQGIETAIFGGLALAMLAFAAWWVHERVS